MEGLEGMSMDAAIYQEACDSMQGLGDARRQWGWTRFLTDQKDEKARILPSPGAAGWLAGSKGHQNGCARATSGVVVGGAGIGGGIDN